MKLPWVLSMSVLLLTGCSKEEPTAPGQGGDPNLPTVPTLNMRDSSSTGNFILRWTVSARANSYIVEEDVDPSFSHATNVFAGYDTTLRLTGKPFGKVFYYHVKGNNNSGSGGWSATKSISIVQAPNPNILVLDTLLNFGDTVTDSIRTLSFRIKNNGNSTLTITNLKSSNTKFSAVGSTPFDVLPNNTKSVAVGFQSDIAQNYVDQLVIESNDYDDYPPVIQLKANVVPGAAKLEVSKDTVLFEVYAGKGYADSTIRVLNSGNIPLEVKGMNVSYASFSIVGKSSFRLNPGVGQDVVVRLSSTTVGTTDAALTITTNETTNPTKFISLSGTVFNEMIVVSVFGDGLFRSIDYGVSWRESTTTCLEACPSTNFV